MNKQTSAAMGVVLIALGLLTMAFTLGLPVLGLSMWNVFQPWRLWPLTVVSVGLGFVLPPVLFRQKRGLGGLYIPGMPILATGGILFFASALDWWGAWEWLWPVEVLSVAAGFVLASIHLRVIWLMIPAIVIGANGLLFQFCAITGLWDVWALMWTIEPLSVGLSLLIIGARKRSSGLMTAGILLCGIGGVGLVGMAAILSLSWIAAWLWVLRFVVPTILVLTGTLLILWSIARNTVAFKTR